MNIMFEGDFPFKGATEIPAIHGYSCWAGMEPLILSNRALDIASFYFFHVKSPRIICGGKLPCW